VRQNDKSSSWKHSGDVGAPSSVPGGMSISESIGSYENIGTNRTHRTATIEAKMLKMVSLRPSANLPDKWFYSSSNGQKFGLIR
jgi:hypothetical protein